MALKNDGTVVSWGANSCGQTNVPHGLTGVIAIAAGGNHSMALKNDSTVVSWGSNLDGQTNVPPNLTGVIAIAAGGRHSMALKNDGTVVSWGYSSDGLSVPPNLTNVIAIAGGGSHSMALKNDGTVVTWGFNYDGLITVPPNLTSVFKIAAGGRHCMALSSTRNLVCWGSNNSGQTNSLTYAELSGKTVISIAAGHSHSMALLNDILFPINNGTVKAWGWNLGGQTTVPTDLKGVIAIVGGLQHSMALVGSTGLNPLSRDTDGDGMPDGWELEQGLNPMDNRDAFFDPDLDGLNNLQEYEFGSLCNSSDTDDDGLLDAQEYQWGTNPRFWDTDNDGYSDLEETINGTDPKNPNSIGSSISGTVSYSGRQTGPIYITAINATPNLNRMAVMASLGEYSILNTTTLSSYSIQAFCDSNGNGAQELWEPYGTYSRNPVILNGNTTNINITLSDPDSDADGLLDWWELKYFSNLSQTAEGDFDSDGVSNGAEYVSGTSPIDETSTTYSISGTVAYTGLQTGAIVISANTQQGVWNSSTKTVVAGPGSFSITELPTLNEYWVEAYRDANGNGSNDAWEAVGYILSPLTVTGDVTNLTILLSDPDDDGDGLPDWWEMQIVDAAVTDNLTSIYDVTPDDDFDGDGVSNISEFMNGTSPTDNTSLPAVLGFLTEGTTITETNIVLTIPIQLSSACASTVLARISVQSSTAKAGDDYEFVSTDITFAPGQTTQSFSVTIKRQALAEPDKRVVFGISQLSGPAVVKQESRHVLTIKDYTDGTGSEPAPGWVSDTEDTLHFRVLTPLEMVR
jgi:hypothetical protein